MRNRVYKRKLNYKKSHSDLLMKTMLLSLVKSGKMNTVTSKAKIIKSFADEQISYAKSLDNAVRVDRLSDRFGSKVLGVSLAKYAEFLNEKYADVRGGFVKIMKTGFRAGDNSEMSEISLLGSSEYYKKAVVKKKTAKKPAKKATEKKAEKQVEKEAAKGMPEKKDEGLFSKITGRFLGRKATGPQYTGKKQRSNVRSGL